MKKTIEITKNILRDALEIIENANHESMLIETKSSRKDLVTEIDKKVQVFITEKLNEAFPNHKVEGEETYDGQISLNGWVWIVDPIDGTANFVKQQRDYGILLSLYHNGVGELGFIVDGNTHDIYTAIKGEGIYVNDDLLHRTPLSELSESIINCSIESLIDKSYRKELVSSCFGVRYKGSAVCDGLSVIRGESAGFIAFNAGPWDFASHLIFASESNLICKKMDGTDRLPTDYGFSIFGEKVIVNQILEIMGETK